MNEETVRMRSNWLVRPTSLKVQLVLTVLAIYLHTFSEWAFFVTKPSFFTQSGTVDMLRALLLAPLPPVLAGIALVLLWHLLSILIRDRAWRARFAAAGILLPALILAGTALLLIDNFTYTIFRRGVISAGGFSIWVYRLLFPALALTAIGCLGRERSLPSRGPAFRRLALLGRGLLLVSMVAMLLRPGAFSGEGPEEEASLPGESGRPNILLLASDGINATHMSLYGYSRGTTPILRELAAEGLLCENCFTNAGTSGASIASMLTGRLPTRLRLIYPPDILRGADSYRHLPGILKRLGYTTFDISVRHHADPYDLNMRKAFDWANHRKISEGPLSEAFSRYLGQEPDYFLQKMFERLGERLLHIYGVRRMVDSYAQVVVESIEQTKKKRSRRGPYAEATFMDHDRLDTFFSFLDKSPGPFFAHLHLLGTHGAYFYPNRRVFSVDQKQDEKWMTDFYDDSIFNFDLLVNKALIGLQERGLRDNTIVVVLTDHGQRWSIHNRIPLLFLFPDGEHRGRITGNTQILDISPTILDYLGIAVPDWMEGRSLLDGEVDRGRLVFTVDRKMGDTREKAPGGHWIMDPRKAGPPFYSLGSLGVFCRQNLFELILEDSRLEISAVEGHTFPASPAEMPAPEAIEQVLVDHLAECGYDVSSLKRPFTVEHVKTKSVDRSAPSSRWEEVPPVEDRRVRARPKRNLPTKNRPIKKPERMR